MSQSLPMPDSMDETSESLSESLAMPAEMPTTTEPLSSGMPVGESKSGPEHLYPFSQGQSKTSGSRPVDLPRMPAPATVTIGQQVDMCHVWAEAPRMVPIHSLQELLEAAAKHSPVFRRFDPSSTAPIVMTAAEAVDSPQLWVKGGTEPVGWIYTQRGLNTPDPEEVMALGQLSSKMSKATLAEGTSRISSASVETLMKSGQGVKSMSLLVKAESESKGSSEPRLTPVAPFVPPKASISSSAGFHRFTFPDLDGLKQSIAKASTSSLVGLYRGFEFPDMNGLKTSTGMAQEAKTLPVATLGRDVALDADLGALVHTGLGIASDKPSPPIVSDEPARFKTESSGTLEQAPLEHKSSASLSQDMDVSDEDKTSDAAKRDTVAEAKSSTTTMAPAPVYAKNISPVVCNETWAVSARQWLKRGHDLFQNKRYPQAALAYTLGLQEAWTDGDSDLEAHQYELSKLRQGRSEALFRLGHYPAALADVASIHAPYETIEVWQLRAEIANKMDFWEDMKVSCERLASAFRDKKNKAQQYRRKAASAEKAIQDSITKPRGTAASPMHPYRPVVLWQAHELGLVASGRPEKLGNLYLEVLGNIVSHQRVQVDFRESKIHGIGMFAKHDMKRGQEVWFEKPLLCVDASAIGCSYCGQPGQSVPCSNTDCKAEAYCSETCRFQAAIKYHQPLCGRQYDSLLQLARESSTPDGGIPLLIFKLIGHALLKDTKTPTALPLLRYWVERTKERLDASNDQLSGHRLITHFQSVVSCAGVYGNPYYDILWYDVMQNALAMHVNFMSASDEAKGKHLFRLGIFPGAAAINHSCAPNVDWAIDPNLHTGGLRVRLLKDVKAGDELTSSYVESGLSYEHRALKLEKDHRFQCQCTRCVKQASEIKAASAKSAPVKSAAASDAKSTREAVMSESVASDGKSTARAKDIVMSEATVKEPVASAPDKVQTDRDVDMT